MDSCVKGISRDGILNSKKSLQHREIKMPLSKITKKDKLDDLMSLSNHQFARPRVEQVQRVQMKSKTSFLFVENCLFLKKNLLLVRFKYWRHPKRVEWPVRQQIR